MEKFQMEQLAGNQSAIPAGGETIKPGRKKAGTAEPGVRAASPENTSPKNSPPKKLDLSRMSPPENLEEVRLEEFTIDGICGVY
jgi:mycofactocin precursor